MPQVPVTFVLTGDSLVVNDPIDGADLRLLSLVQGADVAFTNIETLFHDYENYPMAPTGGTPVRSERTIARSLRKFGFRTGSTANNHAGDYGGETLIQSISVLENAGIAVAGAGPTREDAQRPRIIHTPHASVGLIATTSTFPEHARASDPRGEVRGRPGVSVLRHRARVFCTSDQYAVLEAIFRPLFASASRAHDPLRFPPFEFEPADESRVLTEPHFGDLARLAESIQAAKRRSDVVLVSIHSHEYGRSLELPPDFLRTAALALISYGADAIVCHGPHVFRGMELYGSRPIFYSLGNFFYEAESIPALPSDSLEELGLPPDAPLSTYWEGRRNSPFGAVSTSPECKESIVVNLRWGVGQVPEITVFPITLGTSNSGSGLPGQPSLADESAGRRILERFARLSRSLGTRVVVEKEFARAVPY
jgi:poly-gamma-glutamate capsule biosynthesis protein CapA/YwtB (metallophosphatase superfamily)